MVDGRRFLVADRLSGDVHCSSKVISACQFITLARHWPVAHVLARQEHVDLAEGRPASIVDVPALNQKVVDLTRTDARLRQTQGRRAGRAAASAVQLDVLGDQLSVGDGVVRPSTSETQ